MNGMNAINGVNGMNNTNATNTVSAATVTASATTITTNNNGNNQVSIDIKSPGLTLPQITISDSSNTNNVKLTSTLQDTLSSDTNAVYHDTQQASFVTSNASPQVAAQRLTHFSYLSNSTNNSGINSSYYTDDMKRSTFNTTQTFSTYNQTFSTSYFTEGASTYQTDSSFVSRSSEETAEVVPNHPFTQKVFSVAYINLPENEDELELGIGEQIKFLEIYDDDWALAVRLRDNKEGMVPLTCIKEYFTVLNNKN
eukprot:jgi/Orpsp1_1/1188985/evm.model.d7180000068671.1